MVVTVMVVAAVEGTGVQRDRIVSVGVNFGGW